jgi:hypothetical protein
MILLFIGCSSPHPCDQACDIIEDCGMEPYFCDPPWSCQDGMQAPGDDEYYKCYLRCFKWASCGDIMDLKENMHNDNLFLSRCFKRECD